MKFNFPINNFASGEWSPKMLGRTDTDQYARACEEITNYIPQMTGGAAFRGGTIYQPFTSSMQTAFDGYTGGVKIPPLNSMKMVPYTPYLAVYSKIIIMTGTKWWLYPTFPTDTPTLGTAAGADITGFNWDPLGTDFTALGDLLILTNRNGRCKPKVFWFNDTTGLFRVDNIDQEYITSQPWKATPWRRIEALDSNVTLNPSAKTGTITITASGSHFTANDVGSYRRFGNGTALDGVVRITAVTNATTATATVLQTLPNAAFAYGSTANNASFWQESAWSNKWGWPRTVIAHQGRLIFGGTQAQPDTVWGSRISNFFDFQEVPSPNTTGSTGFANSAFTADNSRPFTLTPNTPESSAIQALSSAKTLTIHTNKAEIVAYGSNGALGPVNVVFESSTSFGSIGVTPVRVNNYVTFAQASGKSIRDIVFNFTEDQFKSTDLAFVADHMFKRYNGIDYIAEMCKTEDTSSVLWVRTQNGKLRLVTLDRDYQVNAWARTILGGTGELNTGIDGVFEATNEPTILSMCTFPMTGPYSTNGINNYLYLLTHRVYNGQAHIYLEVMQPPWEYTNTAGTAPGEDGAFEERYLDLSMRADKLVPDSYEYRLVDAASSLSPLKNTTVGVIADGNYIGEFLVSNTGMITLPRNSYTNVIAGYRYKGRIVPTAIEQGGQVGQPVGRQKRVHEIVVKFFNSMGTSYGRVDEMQEIAFREPGSPMNAPVTYFTGDKALSFPPGYDRKAQVVIEQDKPYPCHVVSVTAYGVTYD